MRVGFLFLHPFSQSLGSTTRVIEIAKSLSRKGFEAVIYNPFEKDHRIDNVRVRHIKALGSLSFLLKRSYRFLKKIYYGKMTRNLTASKIFKENTLFKKMADRLSREIEKDGTEVLIVEQDFAIVPGILAKEEVGIPAIIDLHNITAEELVAAGILSYTDDEYEKMQEELRKWLRRVEGIIVVSEALRKYVEEEYDIRDNIVLVPPAGWPRIDEIPERDPPYKLIYAGLLAYREGVNLFIESIPYIRRMISNVEIYMTKKGEELKKIVRINKDRKLGINFFWFQKREELFEFMKKCHIGILPSSRNKARILGPPVKLYDYLSVGLPVVANNIGEWCEVIRREKIGILTDDNPENFAEAINQLLQDEDTYYEYANNSLRIIKEKYNWDRATETLTKLLKNI